jgi:pyridoxal/pyridoxine/pyridoxamine kinase
MKLLTGLTVLDESRSEEIRFLAEWFWQIKSKKENLMYVVDPALEPTEETYKSITIVAKFVGHCTPREAYHRPDMSNTYTHKK